MGEEGEPETSPSAARLALACAPSRAWSRPQAHRPGHRLPGGRSTTDGETQHSRKGFSHGSGGQVSKIKVSAGLCPSEGGGRAPPGLSPSVWGPQASLGLPRMRTRHWDSASGFARPLGVSVSLLIRTPVTGREPTLLPCDLILMWSRLQRPCFQIRPHSEVPGLGRGPGFAEDGIGPTREGRAPLPGGCGSLVSRAGRGGAGSHSCPPRSAPRGAA